MAFFLTFYKGKHGPIHDFLQRKTGRGGGGQLTYPIIYIEHVGNSSRFYSIIKLIKTSSYCTHVYGNRLLGWLDYPMSLLATCQDNNQLSNPQANLKPPFLASLGVMDLGPHSIGSSTPNY